MSTPGRVIGRETLTAIVSWLRATDVVTSGGDGLSPEWLVLHPAPHAAGSAQRGSSQRDDVTLLRPAGLSISRRVSRR